MPCITLPGFIYTVYPCAIDSSAQLPITVDNVTPVRGEVVNRQRESIIAIQSELGIKPSGTYTTVRDRLDALEAIIAAGGGGGGGAVSVAQNGSSVVSIATVLNFTGGVSVVN